ncbi:MAG: BTAD domain-containing putative transcriptional regulator, partial [Nitrososphaerota archaeon]
MRTGLLYAMPCFQCKVTDQRGERAAAIRAARAGEFECQKRQIGDRSMPPLLRVRLLGDFNITCDGIVIEGINTPRLQSLVAYLVLHRDAPQLRQHLAFVFWPDASEAQARNNLRQLIHVLRHTLPSESDYLAIDNRTLQWRRDAPLQLDVDEFERALAGLDSAKHQGDASAIQAAGEQMLDLYQADLLPGCYDDWIAPERERLRERFIQALGRLMDFHEAQRDLAAAVRYARRITRSDPLNEDAYRSLMRLLAMAGDRAGEIQAFQACASTLRRELGIGPSQATEDLHQRLLRGEALPAKTYPPAAPQNSVRPQPLAARTSLIGREREWEALRAAWQAASTHSPGFVLITGEAGIGKSRLAEEVVNWARVHEVTTATTRSYAVEGQLSFAPVIEWLRTPALRPHVYGLEKVWLTEVARILPELLTEIPDLPHYEPL